MNFSVPAKRDRIGKEEDRHGRERCPRRRISSPKLGWKWVAADTARAGRSVWVASLGRDFGLLVSARTQTDSSGRNGSARWSCPYRATLKDMLSLYS